MVRSWCPSPRKAWSWRRQVRGAAAVLTVCCCRQVDMHAGRNSTVQVESEHVMPHADGSPGALQRRRRRRRRSRRQRWSRCAG
jgi:hypothetical protein